MTTSDLNNNAGLLQASYLSRHRKVEACYNRDGRYFIKLLRFMLELITIFG